ncbi:hypothetical protein BGZ81_011696 [Podila clonocystis]|nr:hypothetical protein BGZ81_011696 [Podila clonocystis]
MDAMQPLNPAAVKGKVVLVNDDFNRCSSNTRGGMAKAAGAAGMLVHSLPYAKVKTLSVRIPYAGVKGDIATVPIVDSDLGFPFIQINDVQQSPAKDQKITFSKDEVYLDIRLGSNMPDIRVTLTYMGYLNTTFRPSRGPFGRIGNRDNGGNLEMYVYKWIGGQVFSDKSSTTPVTPAPGGAYKVLVAT